MKWSSVLTRNVDLEPALDEALGKVRAELGTARADLLLVFASPHYGAQAQTLLARLHAELQPAHVIGCTAIGVVGGGEEVEHEPALALMAGHLPGATISTFHLSVDDLPSPDAGPEAWRKAVRSEQQGPVDFILVSDPFTLPPADLLAGLDYAFPEGQVVGGLASGGARPGDSVIFLDNTVHHNGAAGVAIGGGVRIDTVVAQGCRPVGKPMTVTKCDQNIILGLDHKSPVEALNELVMQLTPRDRELMQHSLFVGVGQAGFDELLDGGAADTRFLIRNIIGLDVSRGLLAVGERLRPGQTLQFHLRDAESSAEDLERHLREYREQAGEPADAALLFACAGRGRNLYGHTNHDSETFRSVVGAMPMGGFFCAGEIGPVGGTTYVHGYTSSFGVFRKRPAAESAP